MKIIVFGATGDVGSRIVAEAMRQHHDVTAVVRDETRAATLPKGATPVVADAIDIASTTEAMRGHDLAIAALRPPAGGEGELVGLTRTVLQAGKELGIRVIVSGGAAHLKLPNGSPHSVLSDPDFLPPDVVPIARASLAQVELCESLADGDWTYATPAAQLFPGERRGRFRTGSDTLIVDADGTSSISMEDFAAAILAEASAPQFHGKAFTVGY